MLIEVIESEWILSSEISGIEYNKESHGDDWLVSIYTKDQQYQRWFITENDARQFCLDFVGLINKTENVCQKQS